MEEKKIPTPWEGCFHCSHMVDFDWYFGTDVDAGYLECNAETGEIKRYYMAHETECNCPYYEVGT